VRVKNTGKISGDEIVQVYVQDISASVEREVKSLKGFARVSLKPGEDKRIFFKIDKDDLSYYDVTKKSWIAEPGQFKVLIGNSSRDIRLEGVFDLCNK
jgi:beta-glucosidase